MQKIFQDSQTMNRNSLSKLLNIRCILSSFFLLLSFGVHADSLDKSDPVIANNILIHFSENPAYTGFEERHNFLADYQKKWLGLVVEDKNSEKEFIGPQQFLFGYDVSIGKKKKHGVGMSFSEYKDFYNASRCATFAYSYKINITGENVLRLGVATSFNTLSIDATKLTWGDMIDSKYGYIYNAGETFNSSKSYPDFNTGIWYTRNDFYAGISFLHITQPPVGFISSSSFVPMEIYFTSGYKILLSNTFNIIPSVLIKREAQINEYSPSILCTYKEKYLVGLSYRNLNTITSYVGLLLFKNLRLTFACGISPDKHLQEFGTIGFLEGAIRYQFPFKKTE